MVKPSDNSHFLTQEEFIGLEFDRKMPMIIIDLADYLTGIKDILKDSAGIDSSRYALAYRYV